MKRLRRTDVWFFLMLVALAAGGAFLLAQPDATDPDSRHLSYWRHYWQAAFDSLSAACGVGLLTYDFLIDYTERGRMLLTALGLLGALLYVAAGTQAARRIQTEDGGVRVPHPLVAVAVFILLQALLVGVYVLVQPLISEPTEPFGSAQRAVAACSSLGVGIRSAAATRCLRADCDGLDRRAGLAGLDVAGANARAAVRAAPYNRGAPGRLLLRAAVGGRF